MKVSRITIPAKDGYPLASTLYQPDQSEEIIIAIITSATAVPQKRYQRYCKYLVTQGWSVITFDYRGVAKSQPENLKNMNATMRDWGKKDVSGIIDWVMENLKPRRLVAIGHSIGGQIMGFVDNSHYLNAMLTVAGQKGYWKLWDNQYRYIIWLLFSMIPPIVNIFGYLPLKIAGWENLPPQAALDWSRWGFTPNFTDEFNQSLNDYFLSFKAPILALSFADDDFYAPVKSVERLMEIYQNSSTKIKHIDPQELNVKKIGHSGFFNVGVCPNLWQETSDWLKNI